MRIVYMGTPEFAVAPLERLIADGHQVVGVFTQKDKPKNRGLKLAPPPVKVAAQAHNIPVYQPGSFKNDEAFRQLEALEPELVVVTAYGKMLPGRVLELPRYGCINVHASLLPDYRGASPIQQVIVRGEQETGVTIMQMNAGLDTGDILLARRIPIAADETADSLHDKLASLGAELLSDCLAKLARGEVTPVPQPEECRFYAPLIKKEDGHIHFTETAAQIDCMARGYQPWPGTFSMWEGQTVKLFCITAEKRQVTEPCGTILGCDGKGMRVACADGVITIGQLQVPGGKRMACVDYFRGHPYNSDVRFE